MNVPSPIGPGAKIALDLKQIAAKCHLSHGFLDMQLDGRSLNAPQV